MALVTASDSDNPDVLAALAAAAAEDADGVAGGGVGSDQVVKELSLLHTAALRQLRIQWRAAGKGVVERPLRFDVALRVAIKAAVRETMHLVRTR